MRNLEQFVLEEKDLLDKVDGKKPQVDPNSKHKIKWAVDEPVDDEASDDVDLNSSDNTVVQVGVRHLLLRNLQRSMERK